MKKPLYFGITGSAVLELVSKEEKAKWEKHFEQLKRIREDQEVEYLEKCRNSDTAFWVVTSMRVV
jgi:hypothetical protein